jgi:hypothetical protein
MKEQANQKGKGRKPETSGTKSGAGAEGTTIPAKTAPMTSKEKIAANQKNKRRK